MLDFQQYESNDLYQAADQIYLINSIFYLFASWRDCGWFWFFPTFGQYKSITEIMRESPHEKVICYKYIRNELKHNFQFESDVAGLYTKVEDDESIE
jgi:hypothetical protein